MSQLWDPVSVGAFCRHCRPLFCLGILHRHAIWKWSSGAGTTLSPLKVFAAASTINAQGWWGPSGLAQWALVAVEAVVIVGGLAFFAYASIDREVFCEDCNTWCEPFETMHLRMTEELANTSTDKLNHLELLALEEAETTEYPRILAEVLQCSGCQMTQAIRFKKLTEVMDEGQLKEEAEDIPGILMQKKRA